MSKSPFAPDSLPVMPDVEGVTLASCEAGIKHAGRKDLLLVSLAPGTVAGGVLTRSKTASAPVTWCRERLPSSQVRAIVVNSGNANAFTGLRGEEAVRLTAEATSVAVGCTPDEVMLASTGVIGEPLDTETFTGHLGDLARTANGSGWHDAASAIMTTDTYPKVASVQTQVDGITITVNGIAKGSGMIAPDMATMLAFIFTDVPLSATAAQSLCANGAKDSFNAITVDSDTSTSDTVLLMATGAAAAHGAPTLTDPADPRLAPLAQAVDAVMLDLAHQIVKDGEGASKFVAITVDGAEDDRAARRIAFSIANSPLVKTAIAGEDPNWGRIVMAVGKAGEAADRDKLAIWFGDMKVAADGEIDPNYAEEHAAIYMKGREIDIRVDVGIADGQSTVWTCDFTADYISINADYRS